MAYRAGVVGGSGYTGAELLRLLAGHPEIEVVHVTADSNAGAARGRSVPVARARPTATRVRAARCRPTSRGLDLVFCRAAARREPGAACPAARRRRRTSSTSAPTSGCRADVYSRWYGEPHRAPELRRPVRVRARRALPRRARDARARRRARLLSDCGEPGVRAAARARAGGAARHRRRGVGRLGRGPRAQDRRACSRRRTRT